LINEFEQESHEQASQNRGMPPFELIKLKLCHLFFSHLKPFEQFAFCTETVFWILNHLVTSKVHYMEKNPGMFSSKTLIYFRLKKERHGYLG